MKTKSYRISKLPKKYRKQIAKLHMTHGDMWPSFKWLEEERPDKADVVLGLINDEVIGWALLYKAAKNSYMANTNTTRVTWVQVYVRRCYRRQGVGTELILRAKELTTSSNIKGAHWSDEAHSFFKLLDC